MLYSEIGANLTKYLFKIKSYNICLLIKQLQGTLLLWPYKQKWVSLNSPPTKK